MHSRFIMRIRRLWFKVRHGLNFLPVGRPTSECTHLTYWLWIFVTMTGGHQKHHQKMLNKSVSTWKKGKLNKNVNKYFSNLRLIYVWCARLVHLMALITYWVILSIQFYSFRFWQFWYKYSLRVFQRLQTKNSLVTRFQRYSNCLSPFTETRAGFFWISLVARRLE